MYIKHPNIVALHGLCVEPVIGVVAPVLEWVEGISLVAFASRSFDGWEDNSIWQDTVENSIAIRPRLLLDICSALLYLHGQPEAVVHGYLKATNVLVEARLSGPRAKLLDFGWCRFFEMYAEPKDASCLDCSGGAGKPSRERLWRESQAIVWTAPERLQRRSVDSMDPSSDVFSFGRLTYLTMTSRLP